MESRKRILAFDVSETLQTGSTKNDNGFGQPIIMADEIIPNAYSVMVGGKETAILLKSLQDKGVTIVLVTNNGADLDKDVINRTLNFFQGYGITIKPEHYFGPDKGEGGGDKTLRLEQIMKTFDVDKTEILFFDDSLKNVEDARSKGFDAIQVTSPKVLQDELFKVAHAYSISFSDIEKLTSQIAKKIDINDIANTKWNNLSPELKANISDHTHDIRSQFGINDKAKYWDNLLTANQKEELLQKIAFSNKAESTPTLPIHNVPQLQFVPLVLNAPNQINEIFVKSNTVKELKDWIIDHADQFGLKKQFPQEDIQIIYAGKLISNEFKFDHKENLSGVLIKFPIKIDAKYLISPSNMAENKQQSSPVYSSTPQSSTTFAKSQKPTIDLGVLLQTDFEHLPACIQNGLKDSKQFSDLQDLAYNWNTNEPYSRVQFMYRVKKFDSTYPALLSDDAGSIYNICRDGWVADNRRNIKGMNEAERKEFLKQYAKNLPTFRAGLK